jgi:glycosyltransferase involved in cell wall biosynthesis
LRMPGWFYPAAVWKIFTSLQQAGADYYLTSASGPEVGLLGIYCFFTGKKMIFRTANEGDCTNQSRTRLGRWRGWLYKTGVALAHTIVVQNEQDAINMEKYFHKKSVVIRSMAGKPAPIKSQTRDSVLWIGRAAPIKDPGQFLSLAKMIPQLKFIMIMTRSSNEENLFEKIHTEAAGIKNLKLVDFVSHARIGRFYQKAITLVNTSVSEGFPNTFIEAGLYKTPVASLRVNPDRIISRHKMGVFADGDIDKLAAEIKAMANNKNLWKEYSLRSDRYVKKFHSQDANGKQWISLFV